MKLILKSRNDIDIRLLVNLTRFIEDHCLGRVCAIGRGAVLTRAFSKGNFSSLLV